MRGVLADIEGNVAAALPLETHDRVRCQATGAEITTPVRPHFRAYRDVYGGKVDADARRQLATDSPHHGTLAALQTLPSTLTPSVAAQPRWSCCSADPPLAQAIHACGGSLARSYRA